MKRIGLMLCLSGIALYSLSSCNNQRDDSVDRAEEMNEHKEDTRPGFVDQDDAEFAVEAADGGMAEVALSKVAMERASHQEVKDFANMMVQDHGTANEKLKAIAVNRGITLPDSMSRKHQENRDDLMKKSGSDFDKAYVDQMVDDHQKTVNLFERAISAVEDPELNRFAQETLPTLKHHLQMCEALQDKLK